jgi:hypothetical protein
MLTSTYRRHRPDSSLLAKRADRNPLGQLEGLERAWVCEHDVVANLSAGDREDLEAMQPMPIAPIRRIRDDRGWPFAVRGRTRQPGPRIWKTRFMNRP